MTVRWAQQRDSLKSHVEEESAATRRNTESGLITTSEEGGGRRRKEEDGLTWSAGGLGSSYKIHQKMPYIVTVPEQITDTKRYEYSGTAVR